MDEKNGAISAPLDRLVRQQEYALSQASHLRQMASEYRQMGFKEISRFCNEQAGKAERWALKIVVSNALADSLGRRSYDNILH